MPTQAAISVTGLVKQFGAVTAVAGIDLEVATGSIFAILGPNGAGKTTLLRMLATLTTPDDGQARIGGHDLLADPQGVRRVIAMTGQFASLDEDLPGRDNLVMLAKLWGFSWAGARVRADELLAAFDLSEAARRQVKTYSGGMRRRLDIAASLVVTPTVLFLDEPTTGLDPTARTDVWRLIRALAASGVTILLTTQYLEEADQLADRIAVIDHGRKIAEGTSRELKAQTGSGTLHVTLADPGQRAQAVSVLQEHLSAQVHDAADPARIGIAAGSDAAAQAALGALMAQGITLSDFAMGQPSLDEVFFALTGKPRAEATP